MPVRILLINSNRLKTPYPVIPFGLLSVAAAIERGGHVVHVLDLCFSEDCPGEIKKTITHVRPDVIGITMRNIDNCSGYALAFFPPPVKRDIIEPCKQSFDGPIVIGGPAVGINGAELLEFFDLELAIRGDGELAFVELIRRLERKESLEGLQGLVRRKDGRIVEDNAPFRVTDLDTMPVPVPTRYINIQPYTQIGSPLQIQTKRGCPLKCTYCTYNRLEGPVYRLRSPKKVADEIELLVGETGIRDIEFTDSTFNIPLNHAKDVLRAVTDRKLDIHLSTMGMNPGAIDEELVSLMKKANFRHASLSVESGSDTTLKSLGKNFTKEDIFRTGSLFHRNHLSVNWTLIVGAPGETEQTLRETFETMDRVASYWDMVVIAPGLRVYNGTPVSEMMPKRKEEYTADNFLSPVFYASDWMDLARLYAISKHAALRRCNYHIMGEPLGVPPRAFKLLTTLNNSLGLNQPRHRLIILYRTIRELTGARWLERRRFEKKSLPVLTK